MFVTVNNNGCKLRGNACGFSLVEVLIAMLVLAIGLLGLAALQAQSLRFNHDAFVRSQATTLAYDIIDRMRANRDNATAYPQTPQDPGTTCDPTVASVNMDLSCWFDTLQETLPAGDATITQRAAPNDDLFDITIMWLDREPRDYSGTSRLPATQAECEAVDARFWSTTSSSCLVTQVWTVWP